MGAEASERTAFSMPFFSISSSMRVGVQVFANPGAPPSRSWDSMNSFGK